ncbi:hypothetical protein HZ326_12450 [Fusarium oxysporum f. sp. albedinis]|nr:hypothetical protein HZ326_12450 [Fusarium oxysporum f. sp. albedinis]
MRLAATNDVGGRELTEPLISPRHRVSKSSDGCPLSTDHWWSCWSVVQRGSGTVTAACPERFETELVASPLCKCGVPCPGSSRAETTDTWIFRTIAGIQPS